MPEILVVWSLGAGLCFLLVNWNLFLVHRSYHTASFKTLNSKLARIGIYWSRSHSRLMPIPQSEEQTLGTSSLIGRQMDQSQHGGDRSVSLEEILKSEYQAETRSAFLFGTLLLPLSWLGSLFMILYWMYLRHERHQTVEHNIFSSPLVQTSETSSKVSVTEISSGEEVEPAQVVRDILESLFESKLEFMRLEEIERLKALGLNIGTKLEGASFDS